MKRTLADLKPNETGVVSSVGGSDALHFRLLDMGLTPNAAVRLVRTAPLGDPIELRLRGYSLTLRLDEARRVTLK